MKIGHEPRRVTSISVSNAEAIVVRGYDLSLDLIGKISFTDHIWLLITGEMPSAGQRSVLDACLVALAEHGLSPSVQAARMTFAAAPEAFQGAVASGVLGAGSVVLGSSAYAAEFFSDIVGASSEATRDQEVQGKVDACIAAKRSIPGYGHPLHKDSDQRAVRLFELIESHGLAGAHLDVARRIEDYLPKATGKNLRINVSGALGAVLLDIGYPLLGIKGVPILARVAGLIAHLVEEQENPLGFTLYDTAAQSIDYEGPTPDGFQGTHR